MIITTIYKCDICHARSTDRGTTERCEASHYELTVDEYREWERLRAYARDSAWYAGLVHNPDTLADEESAIRALMEFEQRHDLKEKVVRERG